MPYGFFPEFKNAYDDECDQSNDEENQKHPCDTLECLDHGSIDFQDPTDFCQFYNRAVFVLRGLIYCSIFQRFTPLEIPVT